MEVKLLTGTELAKLQDGQLVYGTYEEVEEYAEKENTCVDRYFDHVNTSTVYNKFKWVGMDCMTHLLYQFLTTIQSKSQKETSILEE